MNSDTDVAPQLRLLVIDLYCDGIGSLLVIEGLDPDLG